MNINIEANKQLIINYLRGTERLGIDQLIKWLEESDFFTAPASYKYHLSVPGGLAQHSLNVRQMAWNLMTMMNLWDEDEVTRQKQAWAVTLDSLTHDIGKAYMYVIGAEYPLSDAQVYSLMADSGKSLHKASPEDQKRFWDYCAEPGTRKIKADINKDVASKLISWLKSGCEDPMPETPVTYKIDEKFPVGHGCKSVFILQRCGIDLADEEIAAITWHMGAWDLSDYDQKAYNRATEMYPLVSILQTADSLASKIMEVDHEIDS